MTALILLLTGCGSVAYECGAQVLEIDAPHPPVQVVECIEDRCAPLTWTMIDGVLLVECNGGEVLVWW